MFKGDMTWDEAKSAMRSGKKVRNCHFTDEEYFRMVGGDIVCEMGYPMAGWYRGEDWQKTDWSIFQ